MVTNSYLFFLFGAVSLTGQILLMREILVIFHGTEVSIGIFLGAWLGGIGLGASAGAWFTRTRAEKSTEAFFHSLVFLGFSLILHILLIRAIPFAFGIAPAELAPLSGILAAVPAATLATSFLTGFLFPLGCRTSPDGGGRSIARFYGWEALGSLAGGLLFTLFLVRLLPPLRIAALLAAMTGISVLVVCSRKRLRRPVVSGAILLVTAIFIALPVGKKIIDRSVAFRWESLHPGLALLESEPTPYQLVEIARLGKQFSVFGNGKIISSFPDPHSSDRLAALFMAQNPEARRVLLIGGGIGSLVRSLLHYPVEAVDIAEPDPGAFHVAAKHLPEDEAAALKDSRVRVFFGDGRLFVNRLEPDRYDVAICLAPDPVSAFWNRYFTREFFRAIARTLTPRGVFLTSVTSAENFWGAEVASYAGSVYHTLRAVFPSVMGTPGDVTLFFASKDPNVLSLDPGVLESRFRTLSANAFDPAAFRTLLPPDRSAFVQRELARSPSVINTDWRPISSSLAMILWGRFSGTGRLEFLNSIAAAGLKVYWIPILIFLAARWAFRARWGTREGAEDKFQSLLAMAAVGATAMGLQIVLIYAYQSLFGYVFERIGLFAAVFMMGLVAGAFGGGELVNRVRHKTRWLLVGLVLLAGLCLGVPPILQTLAGQVPWRIESTVFALVLIPGLFTGGVFPLVAARHLELTGNTGVTSGRTDAADHYGASFGALITGTLLVPLLGTTEASIVLAMIAGLPAVLLVSEALFRRHEAFLERLMPRSRSSFPYVRTTWALGLLVAAAMAWNLFIGPPDRAMVVKFPEEMLQKVSGSETFAFLDKPYPHYRGTSAGKQGSTVTLSTVPPAGDIRGYGGPINLLLSVNDRGLVTGVRLVSSRETPSYVKGIDDWLAGFKGHSVLEPFDGRIDAISGATITSRAVMGILNRTGRNIAQPILGLDAVAQDTAKPQSLRTILADPRLWAVVVLLCFFVVAFHIPQKKIRLTCLIASLVVLGVYLNAPFTELDLVALVNGQIPALGAVWRNVLLAAVLLISLMWGQAFCGFLCPFGALQELLSVRKLRQRASPAFERAGRYLKFVLLGLLLAACLVTGDTVWFGFSPLQHFFAGHGVSILTGRVETWVTVLCIVALGASVFYFRFWCRYLCPAGAFLALFNKVSLLRKYAPRPNPGRCDLGVAFPQDVDCIRCHRCLHNH